MIKLTISETTDKLDVSTDTIKKWTKKGFIKTTQEKAMNIFLT